MDEATLLEKIRKIEALFAGATTEGERDAADAARARLRSRVREAQAEDPPVEYRFTMDSQWSRRLFVALLRRYGLSPYRYHRQRYTTVMVQVSESFVDETLWPEFEELSDTLTAYLDEVTERIIEEAFGGGGAEAEVVSARPELTFDEKEGSNI